jgi:hypothetical protein
MLINFENIQLNVLNLVYVLLTVIYLQLVFDMLMLKLL